MENLILLLFFAFSSFTFQDSPLAEKQPEKVDFPHPFDCWSTAGCVGIVDEKSLNKISLGRIAPPPVVGQPGSSGTENVIFEEMSAHISQSALPGKYSLRYPVPPFTFSSGDGLILAIRYKLSHATKDKVTAYLKEWNKQDNSVKVVAQVEGKEFIAGKYVAKSSTVSSLNFQENIYFVEVILESTIKLTIAQQNAAPNGVIRGPAIGSVELCSIIG